MNYKIIDLLIALIRNMSVLMVLAYLLTRIPTFSDILNHRFSWRNRILLAGVFGIFSIYGTLSGIEILGGVANFRDLGPTIAGLLAGPLTGAGAGLIGGLYRYQVGGVTALPCTLAPIMAGFSGGILFLFKKGRDIRIREAVLLLMGMEIVHGVIVLAISGTGEEVLTLVRTAIPPMILANGAGIGVFIFMLANLNREKSIEAAKHRIDSELGIAREIQMSMVPASPPPSPVCPEYTIRALLKPAKEVGGDLYNFFPIDGDRLCLAIGDVAGKGVPASLYMAITQKLIKAMARSGEDPASLLARLNRELCDGNETMTFVTLFLCFFNTRTGEIVFSNGGHNPPYLIQQGGVTRVAMDPAMALGVQDQVRYGNRLLQLRGGTTLFLYTDGVTEAMDARGNPYSDGRLEESLIRLAGLAPAALCGEILKDVELFVGRNEQSDDITMLALSFHGPERAAVP